MFRRLCYFGHNIFHGTMEPDGCTVWSIIGFRKHKLHLLGVWSGRNPANTLRGLLSTNSGLALWKLQQTLGIVETPHLKQLELWRKHPHKPRWGYRFLSRWPPACVLANNKHREDTTRLDIPLNEIYFSQSHSFYEHPDKPLSERFHLMIFIFSQTLLFTGTRVKTIKWELFY